MADDEPVDPKPRLEAECKPACEGLWVEAQKCVARVEKKGHGQCEPQYFDYWKCIDACVSRAALLRAQLPLCCWELGGGARVRVQRACGVGVVRRRAAAADVV